MSTATLTTQTASSGNSNIIIIILIMLFAFGSIFAYRSSNNDPIKPENTSTIETMKDQIDHSIEISKKKINANHTTKTGKITSHSISIDKTQIIWNSDNVDKTMKALKNYIITNQANNKYVVLFRFVPEYRIADETGNTVYNESYPPALLGKAVPRAILNNSDNPHSNVFLHNSGGQWKGTENSLFTSWTMSVPWGYMFITSQPSEKWVMLVGTFKLSELTISPNKYWAEYEWLYYGVKDDCLVIPHTDLKTIAKYLKMFEGV